MISTRVRKIPTRKDRINDEPGECHVFSATPLDFTFAESNCAGVNDDATSCCHMRCACCVLQETVISDDRCSCPKSAGSDDVPIGRKTVSGSTSWQLLESLALNRMQGRHLPEPKHGHIEWPGSEQVLISWLLF